MRYRLRTLMIVLALGPIVLAPVIRFAHIRYAMRVEGLKMWQQFYPNIKPVRPLWWIFETTPTYELPASEEALYSAPSTDNDP